jgi:hypothetical protein
MRKIIGRLEKIYFKDLNLKVTSKIDTGAWRSVLHVDGLELKDDFLYFWIGTKENIFMIGDIQQRYCIKLKIKIGKKNYKLDVSLTDRSNMRYSCLLGRSFLRKYGFIVDVTKKNINDRLKKI